MQNLPYFKIKVLITLVKYKIIKIIVIITIITAKLLKRENYGNKLNVKEMQMPSKIS